ncbi:TonB-dependent receptor [Geobacter pelophilus]|uniref:TonB-dependent receptor n=1 Tax=Geoanaerobacter pelophilus TaxID=60036 RepID=A0AAW4L662_9BACT|nr:TonB-dependent receptor [Geoanaerobacter pelophilus]MBT0665295.1 TonB-dependent receptor [Geoanaerobacter pelophilus]
MKKKALIAVVTCALAMAGNSTAKGADPLLEPSTQVEERSTPTEAQELLMFFEEQDLVTATKRHTTLRKAPAIATIITADEIRNMGARNLEDVLKMVPGFGISTNEWGTHMVEVRGIRTGASEKILVMIDGHSLNRNTNGSALVYNVANKLPMENIKQVEVVRGPGSALYGNSAFVATINIITRNAEEIDGVELKAGGGSFDTWKGNLVGGKAIGDKFTASGSLDYFQTDGPKLTVEADTLTGTPFSKAPGAPSLESKQTDAFLKVGYGDLTFRGHYYTQQENNYIGLASALTDGKGGNLDTYWGELAYGLQLVDGLSANLKLYYDYYDQNGQVKIYPNGFAGVFPDGMIGDPKLKNRTIGGELQMDWDLFSGNHLIAGLSYEVLSQYDVKQLANFNPTTGAPLGSVQEVANWNKDATRQIFATYLQDEWQLLEQVNLTAGARYDHYSDFGDTFNPRVGLVWSFLENADLKLLYGQAFRAPNFQELYNINNPVVVGNPNLKPERIETYEAGLAWRLNRYFAADMNYFYSTIDDQVGWDTTTTPAINANIGKSQTQGVEMGVNGAYGADIYWKLAYAWQDPRDANTDQRLPYVPAHRASGIVNYALTKYLNLHTNLLWTGPRPRPQGDNRPEMASYTTVDLAVTLKNFFETLEIQAAVRNLFDQRYKDPDTSGGALNLAGTGPKVPGDFPREGISFLVSASYKF